MRYLFFSTGSWQGNASMVRPRELGREMLEAGVEVWYAVDDCAFNRTSLGVDPRARVVYTPQENALAAARGRRRAVARIAPDFVHVLNPAPKTCAGLWGSGWRVVGDWDEWPGMRDYPLVRKALQRYLDRWLRGRAAHTLVCSRYMQREFRRLYGIEAEYIPYAAYLETRSEPLSPFHEPTAVYVGNFYPAYDHDLLFEAALLMRSRGLTPRIRFLGHGPDLERWRSFVREHALDNIELAGYVTGDELWASIRNAHVLLFPIRPTLLNLARCPSKTFAYAQARRPVIANDVGEIRPVLGDKAEYVDVSPQAFAAAIGRAFARRQADVDYGVERHNWRERADRLLQVLGIPAAARAGAARAGA